MRRSFGYRALGSLRNGKYSNAIVGSFDANEMDILNRVVVMYYKPGAFLQAFLEDTRQPKRPFQEEAVPSFPSLSKMTSRYDLGDIDEVCARTEVAPTLYIASHLWL